MPFQDFLTAIDCANCGTKLVRVPQAICRITYTEPDDSIVCVDCGAHGVYEQVVRQGAGLSRGILTKDEVDEIVEKLQAAPRGS
jgi:hypothetical protein